MKITQTRFIVTIEVLVALCLIIAEGHIVSAAQRAESSANGNPAARLDGPAELPREYVKSSLADTPAPGSVMTVKAGRNLQRALNDAQCGQTIQLQAGATFQGRFILPAKPCDDQHWIILRTSAPDTSLPPEGTRVTPCYAGVASLPGRPSFPCSTSQDILAKIELDTRSGSGALVLADGANHFRLLGLEITRPADGLAVANLVQPRSPTATSDHIVFDRVWIHGTTHDETARGILLAGSSHIAVVDSFFTDFHCIAISGSCTDAQDIAGGLGDGRMGPYRIVNNFLEAAAESILFGGSRATAVPADIEIRHNYLFKPLTWKPGSAAFVAGNDGHPFIVKNHFELKSAQRVLFEGNLLENTWGGFSQTGSSILITPKNQAGAGGVNLCPACEVTDVTIRYCLIRHVGGGMQIGNGRSDNGGAPRDGERYSIHDVIFDDVNAATYKGNGYLAIVGTSPLGSVPLLQHLKIEHVTALVSRGLLNIGGPLSPKMSDFVFSNSIVSVGSDPFPVSTTGGGAMNCSARARDPQEILGRCFSPYSFTHNIIIGSPPVHWPAGNFLLSDSAAVKFSAFNSADWFGYRLSDGSRFKHAGTDGKDLGADVTTLENVLAGVV